VNVGSGWLGPEEAQRLLSPEGRALAMDFALVKNTLAIPDETYVRWRRAHRSLPSSQRRQRVIEVLALALRFRRMGKVANKGVAQLLVLAAELMVLAPR